jgi:hypothetical protein
MTPSEAKCWNELHHFGSAYNGGFVTSLPIYVGQVIYASSVGGTLITDEGTTITTPDYSPQSHPNPDGSEIVVVINSGIITSITPFSSLPTC